VVTNPIGRKYLDVSNREEKRKRRRHKKKKKTKKKKRKKKKEKKKKKKKILLDLRRRSDRGVTFVQEDAQTTPMKTSTNELQHRGWKNSSTRD